MMLKIALLAGAAAASTQKDSAMAALRTAAERELTNNHRTEEKAVRNQFHDKFEFFSSSFAISCAQDFRMTKVTAQPTKRKERERSDPPAKVVKF